MKYFITLCITVLFVFNGCSTKEVYTPKQIAGDWDKETSLEDTIVDRAYSAAKLDNDKVLTKQGVAPVIIDEGKRILGESDGWVLSTSIDGNLTMKSLQDVHLSKTFALKHTVAAASVSGNTMAVLFANNDMALYDLATQQLLLKEQGGKVSTTDMRIVDPYFVGDLVIFATLDGKIVIINKKEKKRLRTVIVSSEDNFNNVIYMSMIDNKIIAATAYKILSLSQKEKRVKYDIRCVSDDGKMIYIATKAGRVYALTPDLQVVNKLKLPFAHILGIIPENDKLYLLEKEGYVIEVDKKTFGYKVYESDFNDGFAFVGNKVFYVDDTAITLP